MGVYLGTEAVSTYMGGVNSDMFATENYVDAAVAEVVAVNETQASAIEALQTSHDEDIAAVNADIDLTRKNWGTITIPLSGWSASATNGWYTNQVTVEGMSVDYNPYADVVYTSATTVADEDTAFGCIKEIETFDGYVIARCVEKPTIDVKIRLMGV